MTTAMSYSKEKQSLFKTMYVRELKRNWAVGLILFIGFIFCEIIPEFQLCELIQDASKRKWDIPWKYENYDQSMGDSGGFYIIILMLVVLLLTAWFFRFLHNRRAMDFYHALPISRKDFYFSKIAAGLTLTVLPVIVSGVIATLAYPIYGVWVTSLGTRTIQILMRCVFLFAGWSVAGAVAVTVSTFIEMIGYTIAVLSAGCMIPLVFITYSDSFLYGYTTAGGSQDWLLAFSPIPILEDACLRRSVSTTNILITILWAIIGIAVLYWGLHIYQKRESEVAGQWGRNIALGKFTKIFAGILLGALFAIIGGLKEATSSFTAMIFLVVKAVVGMFAGYFIMEIITAKGLRTLKRAFPVPAVASVCLCLCLGMLLSGGFGYENHVPKVEKIKSVQLNLDDAFENTITNAEELSRAQRSRWIMYDRSITLTTPEAIEKVTRLHQFNVENKPEYQYGYRSSMDILYETKSGTLARSYSFLPYEAADIIKAIATDPEVLEKSHAVYVTEPVHIEHIEIADAIGREKEFYNLPDEKKKQLLEAVRADYQEITPEELADFKTNKGIGVLTFVLRDILESRNAGIEQKQLSETFEIPLRPSFTKTMTLLEEWKMLPETISPELFTEMDICIIPPSDPVDLWKVPLAQPFSGLKEQRCYSVDDPELIKKVFENASPSRDIGEAANPVAFVFPSAEIKNANEYTVLYVNNKALIEIMDGRPEKISYLLRGEEYAEYQKLTTAQNKEWSHDIDVYGEDSAKKFMEQSGTISVGTYFEQNMPQFLEGKSEAERKAMYQTPLELESGLSWLYNSNISSLD